jgi:ERCC4-related helicase
LAEKARALTAVVGGVQEVLKNLMISAIEFRAEEDADVAPYRHATARDVLVVEPSREVAYARATLMQTFRRTMLALCQTRVMIQPSSYKPPTTLFIQPFSPTLSCHPGHVCSTTVAHMRACAMCRLMD